MSLPLLLTLLSAPAMAAAPAVLSNDKPVEISSDSLSVAQDKHQAVFLGNVIATQGEVHMRADKMVVHYSDAGEKTAAAAANAQGITKIESFGNVVFTNPTDTAKGDFSVYDVAAKTLDLTGDVYLTRDKNILKGTRMHYDMQTSQSVLTGGDVPITAGVGKSVTGNGRVHGLFVPDNTPKKDDKKPKTTGTP